MHGNAIVARTKLLKPSALRAIVKYDGPQQSLRKILRLGKHYRLNQILFWIEVWKICSNPPWRSKPLFMDDGQQIDSETDFLHWLAAYVGDSKTSLDNQLRRIRHSRQNGVSWKNLVLALAVCPTAIDDAFDRQTGKIQTRRLPKGGVDELFFLMASNGSPSQAKATLRDYGARPSVTLQNVKRIDGELVLHFAIFADKDVTEHDYIFKPLTEDDASVRVEEFVKGRLS